MMLEVSSIIAYGYLAYSIKNVFMMIFNTIVELFSGTGFSMNINFTCAKCISFWITLYITGDIISAALVSLTVLLLDSFIVTKL